MKKNNDTGVHKYTTKKDYYVPEEPEVLEKLEWFKDLKLGFMSHFGLYNHYGIVESWSLSDELDNKKYRWSQRQVTWTEDFTKYREEYFESYKAFNPTCFSPTEWANQIERLGFKYTIITTKHHDGFCLWDTDTTNFKVTNGSCPYSANENANIIPKLYNELRDRNIGIATYFSKPDWHSDDYWTADNLDSYGTTRNSNYDGSEESEKWQKFVDFSHEQIKELVCEHGPVDALWLDGGWVNKNNKEDFQLDKLVPKLREHTPSLLVCDRTNKGKYENYVTPEQEVPGEVLDIPWESCITLGGKFGYEYDANYKSGESLIQMLVSVVSRGGNLVLNVAPQPNGKLPDKAIYELNILSDWLTVNGQAIYGTRPVIENKTKNIMTQSKDNKIKYIFSERNSLLYTKYLYIDYIDCKNVSLIGVEEELSFEKYGDLLKIEVPQYMIGKTRPIITVFKMCCE